MDSIKSYIKFSLIILFSVLVTQSFAQDACDEDDDTEEVDKRRIGSAMNTRYGTWQYGNSKRRLGSALNSRYGTWKYGGQPRSKRSVDAPEEQNLYRTKRFLGPALDVRYRYPRPYYASTRNSFSRYRPKRELGDYVDDDDSAFLEAEKRYMGAAFYSGRQPSYDTQPLDEVKRFLGAALYPNRNPFYDKRPEKKYDFG